MLRVALALVLVARAALGHKVGLDNAEVILTAGGSLETGLMRRHGEVPQQREAYSDAPHGSVPIAAHTHELLQAVTEAPSDDATTLQTTPAPLVSCGGHTAKKCSACTSVDPVTGLEITDRGPDWCHGDCTYFDGECHRMTSQNMNTEREQGYANVSTTKHVPDLLNPEITAEDMAIMDAAAQASIEEAGLEAKQRLANEEQREKEKKGKLLVTIIVSCSCVLFLCAVGSLIALYKYVKKGEPKKMEEPLTEEASSGDEGGVEGEGESYEYQGEQGEAGEAAES